MELLKKRICALLEKKKEEKVLLASGP